MNGENALTPGTVPTDRAQLGGLRPKTLYGLPCANCRVYYPSEDAICPVCQCGERVSQKSTFTRLAAAF